MREVLCLERVEQAEALFRPQRIDVLRQLAQPRSCTEVADQLGQTPQRVYYHVRRLVETGLASQVSQRRVRAIVEGLYQATARSYWLSPHLVGRVGLPAARDELSLGSLLDLMEQAQHDIARLDGVAPGLPSVGISAEIRIRPDRREAFLTDLRQTLRALSARHGGGEGDAFRLAVACYPRLESP